ncbi:hypothetical protein IWW40_003529 [Coemansia sp. RSA 1250]|nr:hypothetical protein IWW40_003529 [Coemansia sp. RSA 1250]
MDALEGQSQDRRATISCIADLNSPLYTWDLSSLSGSQQSWVATASQQIRSLHHRFSLRMSTPKLRRQSISHSPHSLEQCECCHCNELFASIRRSKLLAKKTSADGSYSEYSNTSWEADNKISTVICNANEAKQLMSVFQIPAYMVEAFIWDSYRPLCFSVKDCVLSWFYVHSELGNILTHLCGAVIFFGLALVTGPLVVPAAVRERNSTAKASAADYIIVYTYIVAVLFCLAASVAFHTLACHSQHKHFHSLRCDFIGILVLIVGSFVPVGYYGFLHSRGMLIGYMTMFVFIGVVGVAVSVICHVENPKRARWRPVIFMGISGAGLVPVIHAAVLSGYDKAVDKISLWYVIGMCLLYITGTVIYSFKLPERYRPGKHDVFLHSHQIFHVFVVLAATLHYVGVVRALSWAHATPV